MAEAISWWDPSNTETKLNNESNYMAILGRTGMLFPPQTFVEQQIPLQPGMVLRQVLIGPNDIMIPILITAASESALIVAIRALRTAMNPQRGTGRLRYTAADGTIRDLNCCLSAGFEGIEDDTNRGPSWIVLPLQFHADDPFWYDDSATTVNKTNITMPSFSVTNTGDYEMWPVWTIHGPGTNLVLTDTTTGLALTFTLTLGSSDILTIDTTPGVKAILLNSVTNEYPALATTSSIFSLPMGSNAITAVMSGTTGTSALTLVYKQRYLGV